MPDQSDKFYETRQERREKKRQAQKNRMTHHGKSIALIYRQAIEKRNKGEK